MGKTSKVVVCGMKGVGKSMILEQVIYGKTANTTELHPTIEDIYEANIESDRGIRERIRFYDTAGLRHSNDSGATTQLPRQYLQLADGYLLIYETDKSESLDVLVSIKKDVDKNRDKKELLMVVVGNTRKPDGETVSRAKAWCDREKLRHFAISADDQQSLYEPFVYLSSKLNPPQSKSAFPQLSMGRKVLVKDSN